MPPLHKLPISRTPTQLIRNFQARELEGLMSHLRIHGPLKAATESSIKDSETIEVAVKSPSVVLPNPFIFRKNPKTGKWREPRYSLRRQAELVKAAKATGNLDIVPPGPKRAALELRTRRVQASLSPSDASLLLAATPAKSPNVSKVPGAETKISALQSSLQERKGIMTGLQTKLGEKEGQNELDELTAFENNPESAEDRQARLDRQQNFSTLRESIVKAHKSVEHTEWKLDSAKEELEQVRAEEAEQKLWENPLWDGDVKEKEKKGSELGTKLYAGKKKMFKGHLWEKERITRSRKQAMLMRDMTGRVERYKAFYKKRKPNPLRPSRYSKPPKLPF